MNKARLTHGLKMVFFSLIPVALLYVIGVTVSDMIIHRTPETLTDPESGASYYTMKIGKLPWSPRSTTPLNSLGFPDEEFDGITKEEGCVHIVFSGDSFTFGDSVDRDKNYVSRVRQRMAEEYPDRCIRIFNIAERMTTIEQQTARIHETMDLLQPDAIILGQFQNDLSDLTMPGSIAYRPESEGADTNFWGDVLRTSIPGYTNPMVRLMTYQLFGLMITNDMTYEAPLAAWSVLERDPDGESARELTGLYEDFYAALNAELAAKGIEFGVVILPSKLDVLAKRYPEGEFFQSLADKYEVPSLAVLEALDERRDRYTFQMYDGHMSEYGNEVVADAVMEWLLASPEAPIAALTRPTPERPMTAVKDEGSSRKRADAAGRTALADVPAGSR